MSEFGRGYCQHPKADPAVCDRKVIDAHTIQKRGGIEAIQESKHVLTTKLNFQTLFKNNGRPVLRRIGVNQASTFKGFCAKHDTEMFREIEARHVNIDQRAAFLFSFRAVAYEKLAKEAAIKGAAATRDADRGRPIHVQIGIQNYVQAYEQGLTLGLRDVERAKVKYDKMFIEEDFSKYHFYGVAFDSVVPFVACGTFLPEVSFSGKRLQTLGVSAELDDLAFTLTSFGGDSVAVFGWMGSLAGPSANFVDSFDAIPDADKGNALARFVFEHFENTYVRPSWWDGLAIKEKDSLLARVRSGTPDRDRKLGSLVDDGFQLVTAAVVRKARA